MSIDGRIATRTGESRWITGPEARREVHRLRAGHEAIAVGIGTALADDPLLTVRDVPGSSPQRVVFDSYLRLPLDSQLARTAGEVPTIVITTTAAPADAEAALATRGVIVLRAASDDQGRVELADGLALLDARGIRSLLIEGGAALAGRALADRLVDELHLFVAPIVLGAAAHPGFAAWPGPDHLADAPRIRPCRVDRCGDDVYVRGPVLYSLPEASEATTRTSHDTPERAPVEALEVLASAVLPTRVGEFRIASFRDSAGNTIDDVAIVRGAVAGQTAVPTRMHSECLTGDAFGSVRCDCRDQLELALAQLAQGERGILLYLRQEGRGIGIASKVAAYGLQDRGMDTVEANHHLGFEDDLRRYDRAAAMLRALGPRSIELLTNNPKKLDGLIEHGVDVVRRVPHVAEERAENRAYLATKRDKSGHLL